MWDARVGCSCEQAPLLCPRAEPFSGSPSVLSPCWEFKALHKDSRTLPC